MQIVYKDIGSIQEYENNPRRNDEAVKYVANSIKHFGFKVPIVIDKNGVIVCGHTRKKAAETLGIKEVPCVVADDLTDKQINAFRLADNKVAEKAKWNIKALQTEIKLLPEFNFGDFGFEIPEFKQPNQRERTISGYNMDLIEEEEGTTSRWGIPDLAPVDHIPERLISFNYAMTSKDYEAGIHFYIDDYQFERVWSNPEKYLDTLAVFDCVLTPDFSLYTNMTLAVKLWNIYRSRTLGRYWQDEGLTVIPTLSWAEPATYEFCFDGVPQHSTVSISSIGVKTDKAALKIWYDGVEEMMQRLSPKTVLLYGGHLDYDFGDTRVIEFSNQVTERMRQK